MTTVTHTDPIQQAADLAEPIFRLNAWTWHNEQAPPTRLEIAATFSSLAWELRRSFGWDGDGKPHTAATGRLLVTMDAAGKMRYAVQLGND